jgi:hypothetical protein
VFYDNPNVSQHKMTLAKRGRKLAAVPSDLVAELMTLHHRCEAAGTTVAAAVDFWLPYYAKKIASIPLPDAIDQFIDHCRSQGKATSTVRCSPTWSFPSSPGSDRMNL